jgi:hypothetical protein
MGAQRTSETREAFEILRWRRQQLAAAGFSLPLATRLARDPRWDLHALIELVENGCPPEVAAPILQPLDGVNAA